MDRHMSRRWFVRDQPAPAHLDHQRDEPDDAEGDVQPVRPHQREEGGQEGAALGRGALMNQMCELVELDADEGRPEQARDRQPRAGSGPTRSLSISSMAKP